MARTPEQRGPFGRWLVTERKARGWTADDMRARLREARGFAMAHSTYALIESGQRSPTDEQRAHLTAFLGSQPAADTQSAPPSTDLGALIDALTRQTEAVTALVNRVMRYEDRIADLERQLTDLGADLRDSAAAADPSAAPTQAGPDVPPPGAAGLHGRTGAVR
jgi:transcriptional regulator with XRE-family HTH domain